MSLETDYKKAAAAWAVAKQRGDSAEIVDALEGVLNRATKSLYLAGGELRADAVVDHGRFE